MNWHSQRRDYADRKCFEWQQFKNTAGCGCDQFDRTDGFDSSPPATSLKTKNSDQPDTNDNRKYKNFIRFIINK